MLPFLQACCAGGTSANNTDTVECPHCQPCYEPWRDTVVKGLKASGGIGISFSFTQVKCVIVFVCVRVCVCVCMCVLACMHERVFSTV